MTEESMSRRRKPIQAVWMEDFEGYLQIFLETEEFVRPVLIVISPLGRIPKGYVSLGKFMSNKNFLTGPSHHKDHSTYFHTENLNTLCIEGVLYNRLPYEIKGTDIIFLEEVL